MTENPILIPRPEGEGATSAAMSQFFNDHQVLTNLPLTSKQKFRFGFSRPGQNGTFVMKSTGGSSQPDVSPCI